MSNALENRKKLSEIFAEKYCIDPAKILDVLKGTVMKPDKDGRTATNEETQAFLIVANQYDLNPFTREIYAFVDKKAGVVPIVSTDGWTKLIINHKNYLNHYFRYAETIVTLDGAQPCPEWCEVVMQKKDGTEIAIREYLMEVYRPPFKSKDGYVTKGPWQSHTNRMLRHKTKIQGGREGFGFTGIYDEDEGLRIIDMTAGPEKAMKPIVAEPRAITTGTPQTPPTPTTSGEPTAEEKADIIKAEAELQG